jgi:ribosomal protein L19
MEHLGLACPADSVLVQESVQKKCVMEVEGSRRRNRAKEFHGIIRSRQGHALSEAACVHAPQRSIPDELKFWIHAGRLRIIMKAVRRA